MTGKRKYQYGMRDSPQCRVCQHEEQESTRNISDTTHILGGCPNNRLRSLHNKRHDTAVELIKKAISHGLQGSAKLLTDTGKEVAKVDRKRQTLPQYLYSIRIKDVRAVKRPDLTIIKRIGAGQPIPAEYAKLNKAEDNTLHLIEVSYTHLNNIKTRGAEKSRKYQDTIKELTSQGWKVNFHVIILGTLGEITTDTRDTLNKLGVVNRHLDTLLRGLHNTATQYMDKCIDVHELTEKDYEHSKEKGKADRKRKCKDAANEAPNTSGKQKKRRTTSSQTTKTPLNKRRRPVRITTETPRGKKRRKKE